MATLTAPQLVNLRTKAHRSSLYLSVFQPATILSALVTGAPARGARAIQYNTGTGTAAQFATIENFQLVEIDTAFGTEYVRLKSITGNEVTGTITVDENGIDAANGDAIRVKHFYPMVAVPPSIRSGVFYKFYDQVYLTQNSAPPPVCIIGSHLVGVLSAGSVAFSLNSSSSYAIAQGATISSRAWSCLHNGGGAGDISFSSAVAANPTLTITAAGQYWLKCTVTDSNGKQQVTWRAIFVYSTLEDAYTDFTVSSLSGDFNLGGWQASIEVNGVSTLASFPDGALAVIHYKNYFDATEGYVDLWGTAGQNIILSGYIRRDQDNDNFDDGTGKVNFDITTPDGVMDNMSELGSISLNAVTSPTKWWQYASWLTVGRGIHHLLKWHSSVLETCDVLGLTDNVLGVKNTDFTEPSVLQMVNGLGFQRGHFAKMVSSRLGRLYFATDSQMLNTAARAALDTVFIIANADISETIDVVRQPEAAIGVADLDGFSFNGTTSTPFISIMPGYRESAVSFGLPGFRGTSPVSAKSQVLNDQTDSNEKVGRVFAQANNNPLEMRFTTPANYLGAFDIVPSIGWYNWGISDASLKRNTDLSGRLLICRNITHQVDTQSGTIQTSVVFEPEAFGPDGIQGNYPVGYPAPSLRPPSWDEPSSILIFTYRDDGDTQGKAFVATIGSVTAGTIATFNAGATEYTSVCALSSNKAVVCYRDVGNSNQGTAVVLSVSGTTISVGSEAIFETGSTTYVSCCAMSSSQVMVTYRDAGNSNRGTACILNVSGTTITAGTPAVFETNSAQFFSVIGLTASKAITAYRDASTGFGRACVLDVSGSTITPATATDWQSSDIGPTAIDALSSNSVIIIFQAAASGNLAGTVLSDITTTWTDNGSNTLDSTNLCFDTTLPGDHWLRAASGTNCLAVYQSQSGTPDQFTIIANNFSIDGSLLPQPGTPLSISSFSQSYDECGTVALVSATKAGVFYGADAAADGKVLSIDFAGGTVTNNADEISKGAIPVYTSSATLE